MTSLVVDLYAGPGGWDEGMRNAGITDVVGIETETSACATAEAAGHKRVQADVSTVTINDYKGAHGLVASPPCQAWSMAGKRQGEQDRARVHALIDTYAAGSDDRGDGWADERSHHAAQPIRWVRDLRPNWVCLEQVPPVLGLWQHASDVLRLWGYSTWTGILNAADYGVPQTRERAILIASRLRPAGPPVPTHTKDPGPADLFGGQLQQWVSMGEALGWDGIDRPARTVCGDRSPRWAYGRGNSYATGWTLHTNRDQRPDGTRQTVDPTVRPAPALTGKSGGQWVLRSNYSGGKAAGATAEERGRTEREMHEPAVTLTSKGAQWAAPEQSVRIAVCEAAVLQSFRPDYPWQGNKTAQFLQVGNAIPPRLAEAIIRAVMP